MMNHLPMRYSRRLAHANNTNQLYTWRFDVLILFHIFNCPFIFFFFLNDTAPTEIYPLPLPDALPISRQAAVAAGTPYEVTAYGVNQLCGSGLRTVALGYQAIRNGDSQIVVAGGQESMSQAPHCIYLRNGVKMGDAELVDTMIRDGLWDAFNGYHMGNTAENVAQRWQITREH